MYRTYNEKGKWDRGKGPISLVEVKVNEILNLKEDNIENFVKTAQKCAEDFIKNKVSENQIRNFYDYVKNIKNIIKKKCDKDEKSDEDKFNKIKIELHLLRPKIAYAVGRGNVSKSFQKIFEDLINGIKNENEFENFVKFFEAIIAYYKYYKEKSENESER